MPYPVCREEGFSFAKLSHKSSNMAKVNAGKDWSNAVAQAVLEARRGRRWSQDWLAGKAGCSRKTIVRLENGRPVSSQSLMQIAHTLDLDLFELDETEAGKRNLHAGTAPLRKLRRDRGLTLAACARAANVSAATFSRWERGLGSPTRLVTSRDDGTWFVTSAGLAELFGFAGSRSLTKALGGYDEFAPPDPVPRR